MHVQTLVEDRNLDAPLNETAQLNQTIIPTALETQNEKKKMTKCNEGKFTIASIIITTPITHIAEITRPNYPKKDGEPLIISHFIQILTLLINHMGSKCYLVEKATIKAGNSRNDLY